MEQYSKENLKQFKITYNANYIQVQPLIHSFKTQILIDKKHNTVVFEKKGKSFVFNAQTEMIFCSLIVGILKVKQFSFLVYADTVYQQPILPPKGVSIYQIGSVDFISFKQKIHKEQQTILETLKKEIFNFGFYFSFDIDLTYRSELLYSLRPTKPISKFFWNESLLNNMIDNKQASQWRIPIIQGFYGKFETFIDQCKIIYILISRRSKQRSGTRFYSRGIDQNSNCSNTIQTQQCIIVGKYLMSVVFLSGSIPIFWEQKSEKKQIRLTRNKQLTKGPFLEHLMKVNAEYQNVVVLNLLEKKREGENLLTKALQQMIVENQKEVEFFCRYVYFDLNDPLKKKNYTQIFGMVNRVYKILQHFNCFIYDMNEFNIISKQSGVFRLNCLDCMNRTNTMMQSIALKCLQIQLEHVGISLTSLLQDSFNKPEDQLRPILKYFKYLWSSKVDYQSLIYCGTRTVSGHKSKFLDEISSSFSSLQRLYNEKFIDRIKQTSIDLIHTDFKAQNKIKNGHEQYTSPLKVHILTWNVNATSPEKLNIREISKNFQDADLIVFGVQQMMELHPNNVVLEEQETKSSSLWEKAISEQLSQLLKEKYIFVQKIEMVGLCMIVFINENWKNALRSIQKDSVKTGYGGSFGNKGGIVIRINIFQTSICFTCAHLAAGESKTKQRLDDFEQIHKKAFQQNKYGVQNEQQIESSDYKFFFGDLNFRLIGDFKDFSELFEYSKKKNTPEYKEWEQKLVDQFINRDQLIDLKMKIEESNSYLSSYIQENIKFLPTYKLEKSTGNYTFEKNRNPSWCDRILYWSDDLQNHSIVCDSYSSLNISGSDHRPVLGKFTINVLKQEMKPTQVANNTGKQFRDTFLQKDLLS